MSGELTWSGSEPAPDAAGAAAHGSSEVVADPSAPPVRERGVRTRAGNAMGRTRAAVLEGALRAVASAGARRTTMADIAAAAGIAKGTLYNHFRAKEAVFAAAAEAAVQRLGDESAKLAADRGLAAGLGYAAAALSSSPVLLRLHEEPAALLPLLTVGDGGAWNAAREAVADVLTAGSARADQASVDLVLRWLLSYAASPDPDGATGGAAERMAGAVATASPASAGFPSADDAGAATRGPAPASAADSPSAATPTGWAEPAAGTGWAPTESTQR